MKRYNELLLPKRLAGPYAKVLAYSLGSNTISMTMRFLTKSSKPAEAPELQQTTTAVENSLNPSSNSSSQPLAPSAPSRGDEREPQQQQTPRKYAPSTLSTATTAANSTFSAADSTAPLVLPRDPANDGGQRRASSLSHFWQRNKSVGDGERGKKRGSISDSGPYIFAFDPRTGKSVLQKNPHWPNEDSWTREHIKGQSVDGSDVPGGIGFAT